jgi:hypothetical protein
MSDIFIKSSEEKIIPPYEFSYTYRTIFSENGEQMIPLYKPFYPYETLSLFLSFLSKDNFKIIDDLSVIKDKINNFLLSIIKGAFIFNNDTFSWECILNDGCNTNKININIYKTCIINEFIIEFRKLTSNYGDKSYKLFNDIKNIFNLPYEDKIYHDFHFQINIDKFEYDSNDINESINNVLELSKDNELFALLSSIHVIYDMSLNKKLLDFLFRKDILDLFKKVLNEKSTLFDNHKHATIMTIGHFVDNEQGLNFIINNLSILILELIELAGNGDYTTIYCRRESARIISILSKYKLDVENSKLYDWFSTIDIIEDDEIREYIIDSK